MIDVWIGNLGKYNEGELVGEWVKFPTDSDTLAQFFDSIGINEQYEEHFLADWQSEKVDGLHKLIGEYSNLEEINYLAGLLQEAEQDGNLDSIAMIMNSESLNLGEVINLTQCVSDYLPNPDITTNADLGAYMIEELSGINLAETMGEHLSGYFDYEAYGRDTVLNGEAVLTDDGVYFQVDLDESFYGGLDDIPEEYKMFSTESKGIEHMKNTELGTEENYNNIDGRGNNLKKESTATPERAEAGAEKTDKPSLRASLKETKEAVAKQERADKPKEATKKHDEQER